MGLDLAKEPRALLGASPSAPPLGWVLEVDGEILGFFGNIPRRYRFGDCTLLASIANHWAVHKPFRAHTPALSAAYFGQSEPDLLLVTTGIAATGRIFRHFDAAAMPLPAYQRVLYWILDPAGFCAAALRRKELPPRLAGILGRIAAPPLALGWAFRGPHSRRGNRALEPEAISVAEVGDEFDDLWRRKVAERPRLLACRAAADLRWHFEQRPEADVRVLRCRSGGRLQGYLILWREHVAEIGLERMKIVDLIAADDDAATVDALLHAGMELAREAGCHVLELIGFPEEIRSRAERLRPMARSYPAFPVYYKGVAEGLHEALIAPQMWYPSLYDGDGTLGSI